MVCRLIFVKECREQAIQDQSQDKCEIYTSLSLQEDNNPTSSVDLLISIDDKCIAVICNELACTYCQLMSSLGIEATYL
jgi:hypothetical protein